MALMCFRARGNRPQSSVSSEAWAMLESANQLRYAKLAGFRATPMIADLALSTATLMR
jgi:hypothetical protein